MQITPKQQTNNNNINLQVYKCSLCNTQKYQMERCSRCKKAYYCNIQCQKKDYPQHKKICVAYKQPPKQKPVSQLFGIDQFKNLQHIGSGNFSQIFKGISKKDHKTYAIKQIDKSKLRRMQKQADVLMQKHCLLKLKGFQYVIQIQKTFQDQLNLYVQMEYPSNGELWNRAKTFGLISQKLIKYYFSHIVYAISKLHNQFNIVHRDLKPQNILLTQDYKIKLIDFGTAKDLSRPDLKGSGNGSRKRRVFQHFIGTPNYMAPECIHNKASQMKSDIYSLGGVFYFLKTGNPPFTGGSQYLIFNKSTNNTVYLPDDIFNEIQKDLILNMMQKDMNKRMDINGVMQHEYFKDTNFKELRRYEDIQLNEQEKYLIDLKNKIQYYSNSYNEQIQKRQKLYDQTLSLMIKQGKVIIEGKFDNNINMKKILKVIHINCYNMLNLLNDTNLGFQELHKKMIHNLDI